MDYNDKAVWISKFFLHTLKVVIAWCSEVREIQCGSFPPNRAHNVIYLIHLSLHL